MTKPSYEERRITKHSGSPQIADSASHNASANAATEIRFGTELTVVIRKDSGREQAEADIAAIKTGKSQIFRHAVSEAYFHTLRLAVAREPELAKKIAVTYVGGDDAPHSVGLNFDDEIRWPVGFLHECWQLEIDIMDARKKAAENSPESVRPTTHD